MQYQGDRSAAENAGFRSYSTKKNGSGQRKPIRAPIFMTSLKIKNNNKLIEKSNIKDQENLT